MTDDTPPPDPPKFDFSSPYYLGPHDGPGAKISHVTLRRDNYDDWMNSMKMSLKSRRKFGFVDGSIAKPTDTFYLENWEVVHCTLVQWIRNTIDPSLLDTISYVEDASVLWKDLESQFAVVDGTKIHHLKAQLYNCRQTQGMDVTTYFGKLKSLWDALVVHEPPFSCKCGKCTCNIGQAAIKRQDNERLHQFFMGLDASMFSYVRSQQLQLEPLPSLTRAYHAVLQEESLRAPAARATDVGDVVAFATSAPPRASVDWRASRDHARSERRRLFCSYCDSRGHDVVTCYIKNNRFPDWWGSRPRTLADLHRARAGKKRGEGSGVGAATAVVNATDGAAPRATEPVQANVLTTGISANAALASDRLSGPYFEDDDWSR